MESPKLVCVFLHIFLPSLASYWMAVQGLSGVQSGGTWRCANEPGQKEKRMGARLSPGTHESIFTVRHICFSGLFDLERCLIQTHVYGMHVPNQTKSHRMLNLKGSSGWSP